MITNDQQLQLAQAAVENLQRLSCWRPARSIVHTRID